MTVVAINGWPCQCSTNSNFLSASPIFISCLREGSRGKVRGRDRVEGAMTTSNQGRKTDDVMTWEKGGDGKQSSPHHLPSCPMNLAGGDVSTTPESCSLTTPLPHLLHPKPSIPGSHFISSSTPSAAHHPHLVHTLHPTLPTPAALTPHALGAIVVSAPLPPPAA